MRREKSRGIQYLFIGVVIVIACIGTKLWLERRYSEAVKRGVEWIINQEGKLSPRDSVNYLTKIYKVTKDEELAVKLKKEIGRVREKIELEPIQITVIENTRIDWESDVMPVLVELGRLKCRGDNVNQEIGQVKKIIEEREDELFADLPEVEKVIGAYFMKELGLEVPTPLSSPGCGVNINEREDIYCLTHKIIIDSDYYQRHVDPKIYRDEERLLRAVILKHWRDMRETRWLDVVAQSYVALKLMHREMGVGLVKARILGLQNQDGSWGRDDKLSSQKIHATTISILALSDFRNDFKQDKLFCY